MPPIKPSQVKSGEAGGRPDEVYQAFNELIAQRWDGREATFRLKEVAALVRQKLDLDDLKGAYEGKWFDVEDAYRLAGWDVQYEQPGWNENHFLPYFRFRKRKR